MNLNDVHSKQIVLGTLIAFKPRKTNRKLRSDDICFQCGCAGELIQCDDCPRVFHLECISNLDHIPEGAWRCPWHSCSTCGNEAETLFDPGYYCVHCPTSYCSVCAANSSSTDYVSHRIYATLYPPEMNTFSSLRRNGFSLQHPNSLLFVCPECTINTERAVDEIYGPINGYADLKKVPFKISTALMHKKLLRSFSSLPSKAFYHVNSTELISNGGSLTPTPVDVGIILSNRNESDLKDKMPLQIKERGDDSNKIDSGKDESCTDSTAIPSLDNFNASNVSALVTNGQSSMDVCAITFSPEETFVQSAVAANSAVTVESSTNYSPSRTNMLDYPAVRKFFSSQSAGTLCKMRAKGWTFLYPFPISESFQSPNAQLAHKLVGCRCRRYFSGYGKSDGVLVAHLAGKRNEGLPLLHCVHDDGDEEDLDEDEAATAASDFNSDCKTKNESNKLRLQRKHQLELEVQALLKAQGDTQVVRTATTLSRAAVISDACKRAPVECIGYHMVATTDISGPRTDAESNFQEAPSQQIPVVLKRFLNAKDAATRMMKSMSGYSGSLELSSNNGVTISQGQNEGGIAGTGKKDNGTEGGGGGGSDVAERVRLSAWWKEIVRCCRGQRAYFLGLKWQFAFPRLVGPSQVTADDHHLHHHDTDRADNHNRQNETFSEEGDFSSRIGSVHSVDECDSSIAASLQRRIRPRVHSIVAPQTMEHDAFSLLRAECSQSQVHMESLKNVDLDLKDLMGVVIEHLSDSDTSSDEDRDESESEEECEKNKEDFLSPSRKAISPRSASRRPRGKRPQATQKDESMARKFPSLGVTFQADVLPFSIKYANANANGNGDEDGSHGDSKCVWSVLSGPPPFDELSIPCYWSQSPTQNPPQSPSMPVCGIQTPSKALRSVSDDELSALESLVDRTLHAAMLAQYLPGMVVTYIKGVEGEGKTGGGEAGSLSLMKSKEEKQKEKERDRDRDRGDDYLHASRSSKRISIVSGVGVKSARFGCIVKGPFYRDVTRTTTSTSTSASDSSRLSTAVDIEPEMSSSSSTGKAMRSGEGLLVSPCMRQPMMVLHTGVTDEVVTVPCSACCRVVPDDEVLYLLSETGYSYDTTILRVGRMASNLLTSQWRESDIAALFDSGHVHAGNVRGLVVHMRAQRQSIKADQTIYYYTRLRRDHILMNGGEYGEPLGSSDTTALSSSSSSTKAKEKEKEKDALSNPTHIALAEYLRKSLLKDKPLVCAVFRYADQFLGREEEVFAPSDRKAHTTHKGNAVLRKIPIQVPSSGLPVASSSSCFNDRLVGTAAGSGSAGSNSNNTLNMNHIDSNRTCSSSSNSNGNGNGNGSGTGGFTNGTEVNMDGTHGSSNIGVRNPKRPVPILSPLGVINENPPPVDMSQFLKIFLNKSDATSIKRSRAV